MKDSVYVKIMLSFVLTMATMAGKASPITLETAKGNAMKFLNSTTTGAKRVKGNPNLLQLWNVRKGAFFNCRQVFWQND